MSAPRQLPLQFVRGPAFYHELLVGPPGSGKTTRVLERLAADPRATLVVPTVSMAEHLLHEMTRRRGIIRADGILPLADFVARLTPDLREALPGMETLLVELALQRTGEFAAVASFPGFQAELLRTMRDVGVSRLDARLLGAFGRVMTEYESLLGTAGLVHRAERLRRAALAARKNKIGPVFFDGFFNFTAVELDLLRSVATASEQLLVTLPEAVGQVRRALLEMVRAETRLEQVHRAQLEPVVVRAPAPEREIEDIGGRILQDQAKTGRPFRDYGLILRNPETYAPLIGLVFERFGIPYRLNTLHPLRDASSTRFLAELLRVAATGFNGADTVAVLKMAGSGLGTSREMDQYDFELQRQAPGQGLDFLLRHAEKFPRVREKLAQLEELRRWASERLEPSVWAERCGALARQWFHLPEITDGVTHESMMAWRTLARALQAWDEATKEASRALRLTATASVGLNEYRRVLETVLRLTPVRAPDHRRDVVQALSVYEARQWELPVIFVCGLVEKQFPRRHGQNLFFRDADRRKLGLRTSEDLDREERFLFDLACSRATEQLYLTYPARDDQGDPTLRSFFLEGRASVEIEAARIQPKEQPPSWRPAPPFLEDPGLRSALASRHERFRPSWLETYLQCPFQFFARHTLELEEPPAEPERRLDPMVQGTIIHRTIAQWSASDRPIVPVFDQVFDEVGQQEGIRMSFRAEAIRMELRVDLERFAQEKPSRLLAPDFVPGDPEAAFEYVVEEVTPPFRVAGRIDVHGVANGRAALVLDYKYSPPERIERLLEEHAEGTRLQGPLYLLGLEKQRGLTPAGIIFCGLRKKTTRGGWYVSGLVPADPELQEKSPQEFRAMLEAAAAQVVRIAGEIRAGRVAVEPRDRGFCRRICGYRDVCRVNLWGSRSA